MMYKYLLTGSLSCRSQSLGRRILMDRGSQGGERERGEKGERVIACSYFALSFGWAPHPLPFFSLVWIQLWWKSDIFKVLSIYPNYVSYLLMKNALCLCFNKIAWMCWRIWVNLSVRCNRRGRLSMQQRERNRFTSFQLLQFVQNSTPALTYYIYLNINSILLDPPFGTFCSIACSR